MKRAIASVIFYTFRTIEWICKSVLILFCVALICIFIYGAYQAFVETAKANHLSLWVKAFGIGCAIVFGFYGFFELYDWAARNKK